MYRGAKFETFLTDGQPHGPNFSETHKIIWNGWMGPATADAQLFTRSSGPGRDFNLGSRLTSLDLWGLDLDCFVVTVSTVIF